MGRVLGRSAVSGLAGKEERPSQLRKKQVKGNQASVLAGRQDKEVGLFVCFSHVYLFSRETETEHESGRGREREGDTESEAGSRFRAVSTEPDAGLELMNREIMT